MKLARWLCLLGALACTRSAPSFPTYQPPAPEPNWDAAREESVLLLQALVQIPSVNPIAGFEGNERRAADLLAEKLRAEGIEALVEESAPGRGNVLARLSGDGSKKPILLLCHLDVVPVEPGGWSVDAFAGVRKDGFLWGRGAIDDKGMCAANFMAFVLLARQKVPLARDVIFLATADEESGGSGVAYMLQAHPKELETEYVLNEGGTGLIDAVSQGQTLIAISAAEKGYAGMRLYAKGAPGHGSTPRPEQAPDRLIAALAALSEREPDLIMHEYVEEMIRRLGATKGGPVGFLMRHPKLAKGLILKQLAASPTNKATVTDTVNLTMLRTGEKINVVPGLAEAWLDCRILPGTTPEEMQARIESVVHEYGVKVELSQSAKATGSPWDNELFRALERHMSEGVENSLAAPIVSPGYTDSRPFRERGAVAYGISPFVITKEELAALHGNDERLRESELGLGVRRLFRVLVEVAGK
jgi:acetylornithine deacetylase/succinyl-diaminopimelate desuccinylase-like protein